MIWKKDPTDRRRHAAKSSLHLSICNIHRFFIRKYTNRKIGSLKALKLQQQIVSVRGKMSLTVIHALNNTLELSQ